MPDYLFNRGKLEINHIFSFLEVDYKLQIDHPSRTSTVRNSLLVIFESWISSLVKKKLALGNP